MNNFNIYYGIENRIVNVTEFVFKDSNKINNIYVIPASDNARVNLFNNIDPAFGFLKKIFITNNANNNNVREFAAVETIYIHIISNTIYSDYDDYMPENIKLLLPNISNISVFNNIMSKNDKKLHPITFSIPENKIIENICRKTKIMSSLIPGVFSTYIYNNETDYYNEYKQSIFATTTIKGGWDCLRHYEIMANGCIPYFPNIESCPEYILYLFPKELILKGNKLYLDIKNKRIEDLTENELKSCNELSIELLNYTKKNLTTKCLANYVLNKSNNLNVSKILYLSGDITPDYLRCLTLHGFKELYGKNCHDFPKVPHLYKTTNINYNMLYGKGMTYTNLLDEDLHNNDLDNTIIEDIISRKYDLIVYGNFHRGMPFFELVLQFYASDKIILLCGEDSHKCNYSKYLDNGHIVFVRELQH